MTNIETCGASGRQKMALGIALGMTQNDQWLI